MPSAGKCAGEEFAAFAGIATLTSYLFLFILFYLATYRKEGKRPSHRKGLRRMSQAPLPDPHDLLAGTPKEEKNGHSITTGAKTTGPVTRSRKA